MAINTPSYLSAKYLLVGELDWRSTATLALEADDADPAHVQKSKSKSDHGHVWANRGLQRARGPTFDRDTKHMGFWQRTTYKAPNCK
jgi:hypothetical protein